MFALAMGAVIIAAAAVVLYEINSSLTREAVSRLDLSATNKALEIGRTVAFYRGVAMRLAAQSTVQDALIFGDSQYAEQWSSNLRMVLPDVIGVGLFTGNGQVLGDPASQLIGPLCVKDMQGLLLDSSAPHAPVHLENPELVHFDVHTPVRVDGEVLGIAFISVKLEVLQQALGLNARDNEHLLLRDLSNTPLAEVGNKIANKDAVTLVRAIPNTGWQLTYTSVPRFPTDVYAYWLIATIFAVIGVIIAIVLMITVIHRWSSSDLERLNQRLQAVAEGEDFIHEGEPYLTDFRDVMNHIDRIVDKILANRSELTLLSYKDALTGLPNRRAFEDHLNHLEQTRRKEVSVCLGIIDIDDFKSINDRSGHPEGDRALKCVSEVLRHSVRQGDYVARLAGDEFVIVLYDVEQHVVLECFERIRRALQVDDAPVPDIKVSLGYVLVGRGSRMQVNDALLKMDVALYEAKKRGRNTAVEYQSGLRIVSDRTARRIG